MTRTEIISYIEDPSKIGENEVNRLSALTERFPFSQAVRVLHTKGLHNLKSIDYLGNLKITAALTSDRRVLYNFIMRQELLGKIAGAVKEIESEEIAGRNEEAGKKESLDEIIEKKVKELIGIQPEKTAQSETSPEEKTGNDGEKIAEENQNTVIEEAEIKLLPAEEKENVADRFAEFEKQILWEAVNSSIQYETLPEPSQEPETAAGLKKEETPTTFNWDSRHSFFKWLVPVASNEEKTTAAKKEEQDTDAAKKEDIAALVDRFIKTDPKITPQKSEFFTPGNVAKISIVDNEAFVTETLARIYERQGYYQKAIRIYEKLSLKIPGKSAYFASRISELENQVKNSKNK